MPLYDFVCTVCKYKEEDVVANSETKTIKCPVCGEEAKRQMPAPSRILFRSAGGYVSTEPD